ncbi:protein phosphatase 2C domain-containing protein [Micromonospora cathayae]|uniref:Protein phosphatase 2C domain-containing protein n=1 Tax=Micromonospora cathayae TaxID=3028804 RepID=A0ABY7ZR18_9ACTN|nr:protein phosphatase 2C domain-containing protein [Micromonospora sp. HUAS 3]WDZ85390.1 protein phosphatase 2C domain-containing protein [Micromonospora sp. HUAS 3]
MQVTMATAPAKPDQPNEDFTGAVPNAVVLLDGAGLSGTTSTCVHGVAWYTRRLGAALLSRLAARSDADLTALVSDAIAEVADSHRDTCDIDDPSTPSATVVVFRVHGDRADYLVLADSILVVELDGKSPLVITDDREADIGRRYRAAMDAAVNDTPEHQQARRAYVEAMRDHRNQPGGFWVAAADPRAAAEALTGSLPTDHLTSVTLLSDGASRLVDRFHLANWPELLALLATAGPAEIIRRVRDAETSDPHGARWPRGKTFDDATITYWSGLRKGGGGEAD